MGDVTRQPDAATTRPLGSAGLLVTATAGVGVMWALLVLGVGTVRVYNAWALHQWLLGTVKLPVPGVTHWSGLGTGVLPIVSALDFLVFMPLTLLWLVLTVVVSLSSRGSRSGRLYLAVVVVAVGAWILFSVARAATRPLSDLVHPALFTPTMVFSTLLALDGLIALLASVSFWRRASRGLDNTGPSASRT